MFLDKEYFDGWMQRLSERLERIEKLCAGDVEQPLSILPDGERLLDNYDLCRMLNISKRTLQRYRTSGELPYEMIYHKTFYRESDVLRFIERNFSNFRKLKWKNAEIHVIRHDKAVQPFDICRKISMFALGSLYNNEQ